MEGFEVAGRKFRTVADYNAALRDQKKIQQIKKQIHLEQPGEVITLYQEMQSGKYRFETMVGNDFDDEIYELATKYKNQGYTADSKLNGKARKKKEKNQPAKKIQERKMSKEEKNVALEDYDAQMQQEIKAELKKRETKRKLLVAACMIVAIGCFGYFGVYYFYAGRTEASYANLAQLKGSGLLNQVNNVTIHYTEEEEADLQILEEYQTLYNKNKSLIGWLKIDDTNIDYPVMQTSNNEYYLDHNFNQEYDKNGSLFLDADCDVVHRNTNLIIYGHHMKSGKMFGNLNKYSSESYYKDHSLIQFDTIYEKGTYEIMYVFRSRIYNEDEVVFKYYQFLDAASEKEFESDMQEMAALSLYDTGVTASYGDELLTLSTCDNSEEDGRFVVVAKRVD